MEFVYLEDVLLVELICLEDVILAEFMYLVFTRMQVSHRRRFKSLLLYLWLRILIANYLPCVLSDVISRAFPHLV